MPEHLRSLVVILALATVVFVFSKAPACALASTAGDFERRRNLWFAITLIAFLSHNFWIYIIVVLAFLLFALPREPNKLAMYFFLLFAAPPIAAQITGLGIVDHFFAINYLRLLALAILLPAFLFLIRQPDTERFGRSLPDKILIGYLVLFFLLLLQVDTFTNAVRRGVFYSFIDVFLPYFVASRSLRTLTRFRDALMAFVVAALVLAAIGAFEFGKGWLLYTALEDALGAPWGASFYLRRGENLRAFGSTGQPIPLGYTMAVALGFILYLRRSIPSPAAWIPGGLLVIAGLIAPVSRGPWVGAAAIVVLFVALGPSAGLRLVQLGLAGAIGGAILVASPAGETVIDHLPFVGSIDARNVSQRQRLMEVSYQVIMQNPFFGSFTARFSGPMQELRMGDGLIDVVNTYVRVALESGLVGLSLFAGFFIAVAIGVFRSLRGLADKNGELHRLGQALLSTLLGILIMIFTVSSITVIPVIYWTVAGLGVGYVHMLALEKAPATSPRTGERTGFRPATAKSHIMGSG